jgi:hypothetical protein
MQIPNDDYTPALHAMVRVEHPRAHIYTFGLRGLKHWITAEAFNAKHGTHDQPYEINRRHGIQRCQALRFDAIQREPFKLVPSIGDDKDLHINGDTLWRIMFQHAARNDNPKPLTFDDSDFPNFFEPYNCDLNGVRDWFEDTARKAIRDARLARTTIAPRLS